MRVSALVLGFATAQLVGSQMMTTCPQGLHVIGSPPPSMDGTTFGRMVTLINNITTLIPGSDVVAVPYNRSKQGTIDHAEEGSQTLISLVKDFTKSCPKNKFVIVSYSLGSILMMDTLCGFTNKTDRAPVPALKNKFAKNMLLATAYGDESRQIGESYDRGTCMSSGKAPRPYPQCGAFHNLIESYCIAMDPLCCPKTGVDMAYHFAYPDLYDVPLAHQIQNLFIKETPPCILPGFPRGCHLNNA